MWLVISRTNQCYRKARMKTLQYAERNIWDDLKPGQEMTSGLEESLRFTSYSLDPVIGRYFAQARFYDSRCGRMLSPDPVKRGLNRYHYCDNDPVNYEDSTGEIANILIGGALGAITGGAFGFGGSVVSQLIGGQKVDWRKAAGAAANGAITGGVKGALIGSGAGIPVALAADFAAGTMGSAAEQWISGEDVSIRRSVTDGLTNAVSGAIYGNNPMSSLGSAVLRGAGAGAANAGINYISDALGSLGRGYNGGYAGALLGMAGSFSPYAYGRDPRSGCGGSRQTGKSLGYTTSRGYQYGATQTKATKSGKKYSLKGFIKETLLGGVMGGLSSAAFYGGGKAVDKIKSSIFYDDSERLAIIIEKSRKDELQRAYKIAGPSTPEQFNVIAHGNERGIAYEGQTLNAEQVAMLIRHSPQYVGGKQRIKLYSCSTGKKKGGFAQQLANILQTEVETPNMDVHITDVGLEVYRTTRIPGHRRVDGDWIIFEPKKL